MLEEPVEVFNNAWKPIAVLNPPVELLYPAEYPKAVKPSDNK